MEEETQGQDDVQYLQEGGIIHPQPYFGTTDETMGYVHPDMTGWTFAQPRNVEDQGFMYPALSQFDREPKPTPTLFTDVY